MSTALSLVIVIALVAAVAAVVAGLRGLQHEKPERHRHRDVNLGDGTPGSRRGKIVKITEHRPRRAPSDTAK